MKKLKILLAALLVIGSTAKAQVVYGENEKEYIKASSFSNGRTEKKDASHSFPDKRNISYPA